MNAKVKEQILAVRDSGQANMFDKTAVQRLASASGYFELVNFLEEKTKEYVTFILTGERKEEDAAFTRKPNSLNDLAAWDKEAKQRSNYIIEKTIILDETGYTYFADNLLADAEFISENLELMFVDKSGIKHCLFITKEGAKDGILVESEGYGYARYAAYLKD
jgi:hypothetical protein